MIDIKDSLKADSMIRKKFKDSGDKLTGYEPKFLHYPERRENFDE